MTVDAFVERFIGDSPLAKAMSHPLSPEEQLDIVLVMRETRVQHAGRADELDELTARLRKEGANHSLINRATAAYASQFLVGVTDETAYSTPAERAALRVHGWIETEPALQTTVEMLVRRYARVSTFALTMSLQLTGQERADILSVSREVRARRRRHQAELEILGRRLREAGANECAVYRIAALYSAQFPINDEHAYDVSAAARQAALRIWSWTGRAPFRRTLTVAPGALGNNKPDHVSLNTRRLTA